MLAAVVGRQYAQEQQVLMVALVALVGVELVVLQMVLRLLLGL
jgi:hypothetical protein